MLIHKTIHAILNLPLDLFIKHLDRLDEETIANVTRKLLKIDLHPKLFTLKIDQQDAPMLSETLHLSLKISL